jgi:hypothetical protein
MPHLAKEKMLNNRTANKFVHTIWEK